MGWLANACWSWRTAHPTIILDHYLEGSVPGGIKPLRGEASGLLTLSKGEIAALSGNMVAYINCAFVTSSGKLT